MSESQDHQEREKGLRIVQAPEGLDVDEIMQEVRELARSKGHVVEREDVLGGASEARSNFGAEWVTTVGEQLDLLRAAAQLELRGEPIRSHRPFLGRFIIAWKKFVRFWVRKYTDAIFLRQSFFNSQVVGALDQLRQRIDVLEEEVAALRKQLRRAEQGASGMSEKKNRP